MRPLTLPPSIEKEIQSPAPAGYRHDQAVKVAVGMFRQGFRAEAVFSQLRSMYAEDFSDREIADIMKWASEKSPKYDSSLPHGSQSLRATVVTPAAQPTAIQPSERVRQLLDGDSVEEVDLWEKSPIRPAEDWIEDAVLILEYLYEPDDLVNLVWNYSIQKLASGADKSVPSGFGTSTSARRWIDHILRNGAPSSRAGAWIRANPVDGQGISNVNVVSCRYLLVESDDLPRDLQLSFISIKLPAVSAIIDSGGKSYHAWVRVQCEDQRDYSKVAFAILGRLKDLGFDAANVNPSRLSRLPGVRREIGAIGKGRQQLIYLNPSPVPDPIF